MARVEIASQSWGYVVLADRAQAGASVTIKNLDGTNATHWSALTGGSSSTGSIVTGADGTIGRYIETGSYDVTVMATTRRVEAVSGTVVSHMREAPLNLLDARFGGDNTGAVSNTAALNAVDAYVGSYGAELVLPPGEWLFSTNPTITKNGITIRGVGDATVVCEKIIVQADDFRASNLKMEERAGVVAGDGRAIYVDPDGAGRDLSGFHLSDIDFTDFFYAVDFRGSATNGMSRIRCENLISDRQAAGNAGHFNFFYVRDVTTVGLGTYGGQNSASQNFGNGDGAINVLGGNDSDNDVSGGALNFENFASTAKVQVLGGTWGWNIPSGTDAFALTIDDVEDVTVVGADFGGYVRVQTSSGIVRRARVLDCQMTRLRAQGSGAPQYIDELEIMNCLMRGVPGVAAAAGINLDGTYVRKCRVLSNMVRRFQADDTTENWTDALSVARGANLKLEIDRNDFGGRPVTASGSIGTGVIDFGHSNVNYGTLTNIVKTPVPVPVKAGIPADADYDSTAVLRSGSTVLDSTNSRLYVRVGTTWKFAALT